MPNNEISTTGIFQQDRITVVRGSIANGPRGPGGIIPPIIGEALVETGRRRNAEEEINRKWTSLNGNPGPSVEPDGAGLIKTGEGYYREYLTGKIYHQNAGSTFWVYGSIGEKYTQLGGPGSWLGWPTSDEQPFAQDGRVSTFQNGAIYWWPDTGSIDLADVLVRYTGIYCFGETNEASASDEPYVILGVVPAITQQKLETRTRIYGEDDDPFGGVDSGDSREDSIELYRGLPYGMSLTALLMEHDLGDPDKYRETVKVAVEKASEGIATGIGYIPVVGPYLAPAAATFLRQAGPDIINEINNLLGTGDDHIGTVSFDITAKDMVRLTQIERENFHGILWHLDSPLISGGGASYKVYFTIEAG